MRMIDLGSQTLQIMDTATTVECGREVRLRRSLRSLVECMVPCCGFQQTSDQSDNWSTDQLNDHEQYYYSNSNSSSSTSTSSSSSNSSTSTTTSVVTGTFFGYRKGRVSFCLQEETRSNSSSSSRSRPRRSPLLLLELAVPTAYLAREMQSGLLRITLECDHHRHPSCSLFHVPVWSMYCNGRKVGFAVRRHLTLSDLAVLNHMNSVSVGAGVLNVDAHHADLMYMRASFDRVIGSPDSQSFHMINPLGTSASAHQQLSIFLIRS